MATAIHAPQLFTDNITRAQWWGSGRSGRGCISAGTSAWVLDNAMNGMATQANCPALGECPPTLAVPGPHSPVRATRADTTSARTSRRASFHRCSN